MMEDLNTEAGLRSRLVNQAIKSVSEEPDVLKMIYVDNEQAPAKIRSVFSELLDGKINASTAVTQLAALRNDPDVKMDVGGTFRTTTEGPFAGITELVADKPQGPKAQVRFEDLNLRVEQGAAGKEFSFTIPAGVSISEVYARVQQEAMDVTHAKWSEFATKFSIVETREGRIQFTIPSDLSVNEAWKDFGSFLQLGSFGRSSSVQSAPPAWFPGASDKTATIGAFSVETIGLGRTRQEQEVLLKEKNLEMVSDTEVLAVVRITESLTNERLYTELSSIASELGKPMLSEQVRDEFNRREDQRITNELYQRNPGFMSSLGLSGFEQWENDIGLAPNRKPTRE
jgi:hypothetical protein